MAGTRAFDKSGTGNYGTLTSGPQRTVGKIGQALSFDGVDDDVAIINRTSFDFNLTDPFSVSAWVYHKDKVYGNIVIKQGTGPTCTGYELSVDRDASPDINSNSVFFYFTSDSGANNKLKVATPANSLLPGAWHHVAMAYNGNTKASGVRIYIRQYQGLSCTISPR